MDPERWREISDLAAAAAETGPEDREAMLRARPELREEVESLLSYLAEESGPLDRPLFQPLGQAYEGKRIGAYRVVRELGRGGMGVVLLAERVEGGFEQRVAIKLARMSFQSEFYRRRFMEERRILARLEHAHIARLLDGGLAEDGTPYLVMQYVEGEALLEYCGRVGLGLRERVQLLLQVFEAVAFAHENLVVHRDLKPGNILVDAQGRAVLLDFGTARLLEAGEGSGATATALPLLSARYASPEQVSGQSGSVRSDVYSLGVVLYESLTGTIPYDVEGESVPGLLRAAAEAEPVAPSKRSGSWASALRGDLDAILLRALEKRPERRYSSAREFGEDLRRYLSGEAVAARRGGWGYRTGRFLHRYRWPVAALTLVVLSLAGATAYSLRQARLAERERVKAVQVAMFLENLLGASGKGGVSPLASGGRDLRVVDVIEAAAGKIGEEFRDRPDVEVGLRATVGSALMQLGERAKAQPHVERAVELSERLYGDGHAMTVRALTARGNLRMRSGDYEGAQKDLERCVVWHAARKSPDLHFQQSLLAESYFRRGKLQEARELWEKALASMREKYGDRHVTTATMINNLAVVSDDMGDMPKAERYFAEAAEVLRGLPGPPGNLIYPLSGLGRAYFFRGDYAEAKKLAEEAYAHARKTGGERHPNSQVAALQLAQVLAYLGEKEAEALGWRALAVTREVQPAGHLDVARALAVQGRVLVVLGKAKEAAPLLEESYAIARKIYPKDNWRPAESRLFWGAALAQMRKREEAAVALDAAVREMKAALPEQHPRVQEALRVRDRCLGERPEGCTLF